MCKRKYNDEDIKAMCSMKEMGLTNIEIANKFNVNPNTITRYLKPLGYGRPIYEKSLTETQIQEISELYSQGKWNDIKLKYPNIPKNTIYSIMSKNGISNQTYFWNKEDENILLKYYGQIPISELQSQLKDYHNEKAIQAKAIKMNLTSSQKWTKEEIQIVKDNYGFLSREEVLKLIPKRSMNALKIKASQLGLISYDATYIRFTCEEIDFICNNFGKMSDEEMSKVLHRPLSSIREKRAELGLYYINKDYSNYESISKLFRGHINDWKESSMKRCNYCCVITGSKNFKIHHLFGFNNILSETYSILDKMELLHGYNINNYSKEELDRFIKIFSSIHSKYPLGICLREDIHNQFHKEYGSGGNTPEQFKRFIERHNYKLSIII